MYFAEWVEHILTGKQSTLVQTRLNQIKNQPTFNQPQTLQSNSVSANPSLGTNNQVKCPKCGSPQIQATSKGFSAGNAAVGGILLGPLGLAGGLLGSTDVRLVCLNCGLKWEPGKQYIDPKVLKQVEELRKERQRHSPLHTVSTILWIIIIILVVVFIMAMILSGFH